MSHSAKRLGRTSEGKLIERPLSPHLQVYKWQITMVMSILHRITGIVLAAGGLVLAWWLVAAAASPSYFAMVQGILGSWIGKLFLFGWTFALFYHLCNGIRHLWWDMGRGYELPTVYRSGYATLMGAGGLTLLAWIIAFAAR